MTVITMSREVGSGEILIAKQLAKRLSWKVIDREIIIKAAQLAKCSQAQIEKFDQEQFDRMNAFFSDITFPVYGGGGMYPFINIGGIEPYWVPGIELDPNIVDETKYIQLTQTVMEKLADKGNVIIIGRGASVFLQNRPDTLHLRIIAPLDQRLHHMMKEAKVDDAKAKHIITTKDKASAQYLKHFYNANWADPLLYHLVINTGKVSTPEAVELILSHVEFKSAVV